jgi:uncharacterized protein
METIRRPTYRVTYEGKDVTADLVGLLNIVYIDKVEGESDEIALTFEDVDALWRGPWYPRKGDKVKVEIGYDADLVDCGTFDVDQLEYTGPPDVFEVRGIAAGVTAALRTKNSKAYEKQTLEQIARAIAGKYGMSIVGTIEPVRFERVTQNRETDLFFLKRISIEYGYVFSVRDKKLIFSKLQDLDKSAPVAVIDRRNLASFSLKDKATATYKNARVKYHDPKTKRVYEYQTTDNNNADGQPITDPTAEDTLEIRTKAENGGQAEAKAKAALYKANTKSKEGTLSVEGNPLLLAGATFELTGMGEFSGKYNIVESSHFIDNGGGYTTSVTIRQVGYVEDDKKKPTEPFGDAKYQKVQASKTPPVTGVNSGQFFQTLASFKQLKK